MDVSGNPKELALLRSFAPFDGMKPESVVVFARKMTRRQAPKGRLLFTEGDEEKQTFYLISGSIDLLAEGEIVGSVKSGTPKSKSPLAHQLPRPYSAVVTSDRIEYFQIDSEFLDVAVTLDQTGAYKVLELNGLDENAPGPDDWMTALLQTKAFHKIPPANIQAVFMRAAADRLPRRRSGHQARRCRAIISTSSSKVFARSRARRRSTRMACGSPSSRWAIPSARKR